MQIKKEIIILYNIAEKMIIENKPVLKKLILLNFEI